MLQPWRWGEESSFSPMANSSIVLALASKSTTMFRWCRIIAYLQWNMHWNAKKHQVSCAQFLGVHEYAKTQLYKCTCNTQRALRTNTYMPWKARSTCHQQANCFHHHLISWLMLVVLVLRSGCVLLDDLWSIHPIASSFYLLLQGFHGIPSIYNVIRTRY